VKNKSKTTIQDKKNYDEKSRNFNIELSLASGIEDLVS
jgi:hypothetical protein